MASLVTVAQADLGLRLNLDQSGSPLAYTDARLPDVELKLQQATDIVVDYIKRPDHGWTQETVPGNVSSAILLVFAALFDDAGTATALAALANSDVKSPIVALLMRFRDPTLA